MKNCNNTKNDIPAIICFAGCDWWYHNRGLFCPQVMTRLAKHYKILFVNSLPMRFPSLRRDKNALKKILRKLNSLSRYLRKSDNGMYVFSPLSLPFFTTCFGRRLSVFSVFLQVKLVMTLLGFRKPIIYVNCPPALGVVKRLNPAHLIYERTDLFEEMPGANKSYIASLNDELIKSADLVLYVNTTLWEQGTRENSNSLLLGHGVDFELFANAEKSSHIPDDIAAIPRPIVGYFGDINEDACDLLLLEYVARKLPDISLLLIGPISADVRSLRAYENVFFLGQKPYYQIPFYGKEFDVAIMPWNKNKWIEFCNPVKTKEYLSLGKPIVSIDYPELRPYHDVVYAASDYEQFVDFIRTAIKENDPHVRQKRKDRVKDETWDNKVDQIMRFIEENLKQTEKIEAKRC